MKLLGLTNCCTRIDHASEKESKFRNLSSKRATIIDSKPIPDDFVRFYSGLFSHNDRVSNPEHVEIEDVVLAYNSSIIKQDYEDCFSAEDVSRVLIIFRMSFLNLRTI